MFAMDTLLSYIITFVIVIVVLKLISIPFKILLRLAINALIGGALLYLLAKIGIVVTLTWWMAAIVAIAGVPGVIIVVILGFVL